METDKSTEKIINALVFLFIAIWLLVLSLLVILSEQTKLVKFHQNQFKIDSLIKSKKPL